MAEDAVAEDTVAEDTVAEDTVAEDTVPAGTGTEYEGSRIEPTSPTVPVPATVPATAAADAANPGNPATAATAATPGSSATGPVRLDAELVRRGLARARGQAGELVAAGRVVVDGRTARKASQQVSSTAELAVAAGDAPDYVGRGARKLAGVLDDLTAAGGGPVVAGRRCLDAGASTGGFTQVLLERGAAHVVAVDVGHGQLAAAVRDDDRVDDREGTSVRGLPAAHVGGAVDLLVGDLSFISVAVVLGDLVALVKPGGDLLVLVKPQFEVGRERLGSGGVVRDVGRRVDAVLAVLRAAVEVHGLLARAVRASRWPGPSGNVEYFVWLTRPAPQRGSSGLGEQGAPATPGGPTTPLLTPDALERGVRTAVAEGPQ